jgi:membrane protein insertase Oxa1/YidC/SpoIIIJ
MTLSNIQKRILLFLFGCVPARAALIYIATTSFKQALAALLTIPAFGFFYLYATNSRLTGAETFGEPIWWKDLRVVHGMFYAWFVVSAVLDMPHAALPLVLDLAFGIVAFLTHHA